MEDVNAKKATGSCGMDDMAKTLDDDIAGLVHQLSMEFVRISKGGGSMTKEDEEMIGEIGKRIKSIGKLRDEAVSIRDDVLGEGEA